MASYTTVVLAPVQEGCLWGTLICNKTGSQAKDKPGFKFIFQLADANLEQVTYPLYILIYPICKIRSS